MVSRLSGRQDQPDLRPNPVSPVLAVIPPPVVEASLAVTSPLTRRRKFSLAKGIRQMNLEISSLTPSGMANLMNGVLR